MRWKETLFGLALALALAAGCQKQCYLTEADDDHYRHNGLSADLCKPPVEPIYPTGGFVPPPPTVDKPEREIRYISLAEALALALERGTVGSTQLDGHTNDNPLSFSGRALFSQENGIRVLALEPAIVGTDIETALSKFDARWVTSMTWSNTDRPVATSQDTFQAGGLGSNINTIQTNDSTVASTLLKPLPTGGVAGITFRTDYELTNLPARVNPSYRPNLQFQLDQPLLQGFGVDINQLRSSHPGSTPNIPGLFPPAGLLPFFPVGGKVEGILITRIRFDEQRAEFERQVHQMLANVEIAYWNLYGAYWNLYSREQGLKDALEAWRIAKVKVDGGTGAPQDEAHAREQYERFRGQRVEALNLVLDTERNLRGLIGLEVEDCTRLVPCDKPTLASYQPDWCTALNEALSLRPELVLARQEVKLQQLDLINQRNLLLPDLRFVSTYDFNGVGSHLGGGPSDPNNALGSIGSGRFNDWSLGLRMDVPIGFREAHASVRTARLRLAKSYAFLYDQEERTKRFLDLHYQQIPAFYAQSQADHARWEAAKKWEAGTKTNYLETGTAAVGSNFDLLASQQAKWDALRDEKAAIVSYNNSLVRFEYAKGTIMQHNNIHIAEGPLPHCAQVRAVEHERQRSKALVLRERENPMIHQPGAIQDGESGLLNLPENAAPSLPALFKGQADQEDDGGKAIPSPESLPAPAKKMPSDDQAVLPAPLSTTQDRLKPREVAKPKVLTIPDKERSDDLQRLAPLPLADQNSANFIKSEPEGVRLVKTTEPPLLDNHGSEEDTPAVRQVFPSDTPAAVLLPPARSKGDPGSSSPPSGVTPASYWVVPPVPKVEAKPIPIPAKDGWRPVYPQTIQPTKASLGQVTPLTGLSGAPSPTPAVLPEKPQSVAISVPNKLPADFQEPGIVFLPQAEQPTGTWSRQTGNQSWNLPGTREIGYSLDGRK